MRCAIYTRVSTDNQAEVEFNSCEAQEAKVKAFIESQENFGVFKVYSDAGLSGANLERSALQAMLRDIENKLIDVVIVYKIDRLTRSPKDFYYLMEIFEQYNVDFISVTERFDTSTPSGRLLRNIMLTFAQFERELTSERTRDKLLERAQKGMWNGGNVPFGYKVIDKRLVPDKEKSQKLLKIFAIFIESGSLAKTYQILKAQRIFNSKGSPFSKTSIQKILQNVVYIGKTKYAGNVYQGIQQPLISEDLFNCAQKFQQEKKRKLRLYKDYLWGGLVQCAECNSIMTPAHTNKKSMKRYYYYRCTKTFRQNWDSCSTRQINADRLERFIIDNLKRISLDTHYIESSIFKLNFEASRVQNGLEPSASCSQIDPKNVQNRLKSFTENIDKLSKVEQSLLIKNHIKSIIYSKNFIQINWLCPAQHIEGQSLKNPDPALNDAACGRVAAAASRRRFFASKEKGITSRSNPLSTVAPLRQQI